jgi:hypothetical protein
MYQLSHVTHAIIELIRAEFSRRFGESIPVSLVPTLPDPKEGGSNVHVYLYHVKECPHNRNLPSPGGAGPVPIQHTPLVLVLQYLITTVHGADSTDGDGSNNYFVEQDYLGYVARAIHDYPVLTKGTEFPLITDSRYVNHLGDYIDEDTELELILRPAAPEETISFYSAGQQQGIRPTLFVEARVALIEPEPPKTTLPGIVLHLGTVVAPMGKVGLVGTRSTLGVWQLGSLVKLDANPGRVAVFDSVNLPPGDGINDERDTISEDITGNNRLTIETFGTIGGDAELLLEGNGQRIRVPRLAGTSWNFEHAVHTLSMSVFTTIRGYLNDATVTSDIPIVPGLYSARLLVRYPDFRTRTTNSVAFFVMPQVLALTPGPAAGEFTLTISGQYLDSELVSEIEVSAGSVGLRRRPPTLDEDHPPSDDGTFRVSNNSVIFNLPQTEPTTGRKPVQLSVNGVPALPIYFEF